MTTPHALAPTTTPHPGSFAATPPRWNPASLCGPVRNFRGLPPGQAHRTPQNAAERPFSGVFGGA